MQHCRVREAVRSAAALAFYGTKRVIKFSLVCTLRVMNTDPLSGILFFFFGAFAKLRKATVSFGMSVCLSAWNNSTPTARSLMKFDI